MERHIRERASTLFAAMAHVTRVRIVELLLDGEKTVGEITAALGLQQSNTSQHLQILTRAGVLVVEQRKSSRYYRTRGPRIGQILALIEEFCTVHSLYGPDDDTSTGPSDSTLVTSTTSGSLSGTLASRPA